MTNASRGAPRITIAIGASLVASFVASLVAAPLGAQQATPPPAAPVEARSMMQGYIGGVTALSQGRPADAVRLLAGADRFSPGAPFVLVALAKAQVRAGDVDGAVATLGRLRPYGLARDLRADTSLAALRARPAFDSLARALVDAARPVIRGDTAATLADGDLIPESIAHDAADGALYVGSLARRMILVVQHGGATRTWLDAGRDGMGQVLGMHVEPGARRLWVANWVPDSTLPVTAMGTSGRAQLHVLELPSGRLVRRLALPTGATPHLLNDLAFAPDGAVYLTDSHAGAVWRLRRGADSLELFHDGKAGALTYPNGITTARDGRSVYVAHMEGLTRLDLATGKATPVAVADGHYAGRIDGLYACGGDLVAVQGLVDDERIVRLTLDASGTRVTGSTTLERRHPSMRIPTTGALVGDTLWYVANSQLDRMRNVFAVTPAKDPVPTIILRVPVGACR